MSKFRQFFLLIFLLNFFKRGICDSGYFIQVTDVHLDPIYMPHSLVVTDCHSLIVDKPGEPSFPLLAGKWGTRYYCDSPAILVNASFKFISSLIDKYDADFVVWTGDSPRHNGDPIFHPTTLEIIEQLDWQLSQLMFTTTYRSDRTVMVYPSIGNNDVYPHDTMYPGPYPLLTNITANWNYWLSSNQAAEKTMYNGGYYSMLHDKQLRIVSLNTLYFALFNDVVGDCDNSSSPAYTQIQWLNETLYNAEVNGEKVYLTGHVPPEDALYKPACAVLYAGLTERYEEIILAHLYGHTHTDWFALIYGPVSNQPVGVVNVAPSIVPTFNPTVRVFEYDKQTKAILNYYQYYADIVQTNKNDNIEFMLEYDPISAYNMQSLSVQSWVQLNNEIENNPKIKALYNLYVTVSTNDTAPWDMDQGHNKGFK